MGSDGQMLKDMQRIEELVGQLDAVADPAVRNTAVELVQLLMDLHGEGIARMLRMVQQNGAAGVETVSRFGRDELVGQLLMLYSLHPVDLETRVREALAKVRPLLESHGGNVELLGIDEGLVRLRLVGNCDGCPSSGLTMKNAIEAAVYAAAADIAGLEVAGLAEPGPPPGFVPLETITTG